jgi:tRNA (cmo5U34)-methyltransferase
MNSRTSSTPEKMAAFFDQRADGYDQHMQTSVARFESFYAAVAQPIACTDREVHVLDIGCGTGLELERIFQRAPNARITAIDLSEKMLTQLRSKYAERSNQIKLIQDSYLDVNFGERCYDYSVSVMTMTLHHLLPTRKMRLYQKIRRSLKEGGRYIEGDYVVSKEKEAQYLAECQKKIALVGDSPQSNYHLDIPLTIERKIDVLHWAGFTKIDIIWEEKEAIVLTARCS